MFQHGELPARAHAKRAADVCTDKEAALIERLSRRDPVACAHLLHDLDGVLCARVRKLRRRYAAVSCGDTAAEEADLLQDIRLELWIEAPRLAAVWDPGFGLSVHAFFALVADRRLRSTLRARRRHGIDERPTESAVFAALREPCDAERHALVRDELRRVLTGLPERVSPKAYALFCAVVLHDEPVAAACGSFGSTEEGVYACISRVRAAARSLRTSISGNGRQQRG